jgi:ferritin-like metal-binding protein YciE
MALSSATEARSLFVTGLQNAHAVENQALSLMNRQIERIEQYPEVAARMRAHVEETNGQIGRLEQILGSLNESHSSIKDLGASFMANMGAIGHAVTGDEILKNSFANYAFENYEAAAYKSLITMAEVGGFRDSIPLLEQSLREEQSMAQWLDEHLPQVTTRYMELYASGEQAQR